MHLKGLSVSPSVNRSHLPYIFVKSQRNTRDKVHIVSAEDISIFFSFLHVSLLASLSLAVLFLCTQEIAGLLNSDPLT